MQQVLSLKTICCYSILSIPFSLSTAFVASFLACWVTHPPFWCFLCPTPPLTVLLQGFVFSLPASFRRGLCLQSASGNKSPRKIIWKDLCPGPEFTGVAAVSFLSFFLWYAGNSLLQKPPPLTDITLMPSLLCVWYWPCRTVFLSNIQLRSIIHY